MRLCVLLIICFISTSINAQDTISIEEKANTYYEKLNIRFNEEGRLYNLEYIDKYGYPPPVPDPIKGYPFSNKFFKEIRDSLINGFYEKSECLEPSIDYLEEKLLIWELMKGGSIPDSTFLLLIDAYYKIAPKSAVDFCISRWNFRKFHVMDKVEYHEVPWIKNYPYVVFLFDNLNTSDLLNILMEKNNLEINSNKSFIDLCMKELGYNKSNNELKIIEDYVKAKQEIDLGLQFNSYFISVFEKLYIEK